MRAYRFKASIYHEKEAAMKPSVLRIPPPSSTRSLSVTIMYNAARSCGGEAEMTGKKWTAAKQAPPSDIGAGCKKVDGEYTGPLAHPSRQPGCLTRTSHISLFSFTRVFLNCQSHCQLHLSRNRRVPQQYNRTNFGQHLHASMHSHGELL